MENSSFKLPIYARIDNLVDMHDLYEMTNACQNGFNENFRKIIQMAIQIRE